MHLIWIKLNSKGAELHRIIFFRITHVIAICLTGRLGLYIVYTVTPFIDIVGIWSVLNAVPDLANSLMYEDYNSCKIDFF